MTAPDRRSGTRDPSAPLTRRARPPASESDPGTQPPTTGELPVPFAPWQPTTAPIRGWMAEWALITSIVGLISSLFVGWAFPVALLAIVLAVMALRRPIERRAPAVWALALSALALIYSTGWLIYAVTQLSGGSS